MERRENREASNFFKFLSDQGNAGAQFCYGFCFHIHRKSFVSLPDVSNPPQRDDLKEMTSNRPMVKGTSPTTRKRSNFERLRSLASLIVGSIAAEVFPGVKMTERA
jgi:hypothetical protein